MRFGQVGLQLGIAMQQVDCLEQLNQTNQKEQLLSKITDRLRQVTDLPKAL